MFGTSRIAVSVGSWVAATALLCATAVLSPDAARAQTASNLNCNKCVGTRDIARRAITRSRLKNNAVTFRKMSPAVESAIKQDRTFYVTLDSSGDQATLVRQGPLRLFARCFVNDAGNDRVEFVLTSTEGGWFVLDGSPVRTAGEQVTLPIPAFVPTGTTSTQGFGVLGAIAPDGSAIGAFSLVGVGLNVFGHPCVVFGSATAITGSP